LIRNIGKLSCLRVDPFVFGSNLDLLPNGVKLAILFFDDPEIPDLGMYLRSTSMVNSMMAAGKSYVETGR